MSDLAARGALIILPAPEAPPIDWSPDRRRRPHGSEGAEPTVVAGSQETAGTVTWGALKSRYR